MAAPSVPFTVIPGTDLDPDSPLTTELMVALFENGVFNNEWMGTRANADVEHAHTGLGNDGTKNVDGADITNIAASFQASMFRLAWSIAATVVGTATTGALGFTPVGCWAIGIGEQTTAGPIQGNSFVGFATGTGTLARGLGIDVEDAGQLTPPLDASGIGGFPSTRLAGGPQDFGSPIDVTVFGAGGITLSFVDASDDYDFTVDLMVFGG